MNLLPFLPVINILGFIILGIAMIYTQWRIGSSKVAVDGTKVGIEVIQTYKEQVAQLREEMENSRKLINELTVKVTRLESAAVEKDKKISELTLFLIDKSPNQQEFMNRMDALRDMIAKYIERADVREDKIYMIIKNRQAYVVPLKETVT